MTDPGTSPLPIPGAGGPMGRRIALRRIGRLLSVLAVLGIGAAAALAEHIPVSGPIDDEAFYRLVACAAPPGGECQKPFVRWPYERALGITVGITRIDDTIGQERAAGAQAALVHAIDQINRSGARVWLRNTADRPDIQVLLLDIPKRSVLSGTGVDGLDGNRIDAAHVHVWWNGRREITRGAIVISNGVARNEMMSTMLEEVYQALGLMTDIDHPYYSRTSIVAQVGTTQTTPGRQDLMALRRHYP
jgi:hypothetical protein